MKKITSLIDNGRFWQYFHGGAGDFLDCAVDIRYNNGTRSQRGVHIASVYSGIGFGLRRLVAVGAGGKERGR